MLNIKFCALVFSLNTLFSLNIFTSLNVLKCIFNSFEIVTNISHNLCNYLPIRHLHLVFFPPFFLYFKEDFIPLFKDAFPKFYFRHFSHLSFFPLLPMFYPCLGEMFC